MNTWMSKLKRQYHLHLLKKRMKYLSMNLTKCVWDLHAENYSVPRKGIDEDLNKWGRERINI